MAKPKVISHYEMCKYVLKALKQLGGSANIGELNSRAIEIMALPEEICNILHKENGTQTEVEYRLAWARTYLKNKGFLQNSSRGVWAFAEGFDGNTDIALPDGIVERVDDSLKEGSGGTRPVEGNDFDNGSITLTEEAEAMDWREKLRQVLLEMPPDAFERLTLRLLRESGFTQVEVTGKSNDKGIDGKGIIQLNGVMSFHMIFQCKRYKGSVGSSEMRDFRGAMQGRADKGLFITTGSFTLEAKKEAKRDGVPALDLIDGDELIEMLKNLSLGVTEKVDYEIDKEWFMKI